jgi:hypothetical protein
MTIAVRDGIENGLGLVSFEVIVDCLEPEACRCFWRVPVIDGMLSPHDDSYTIDDAYAYDCEFKADGGDGFDFVICCLDSSQWKISTELGRVVNRLEQNFKDTHEIGEPT